MIDVPKQTNNKQLYRQKSQEEITCVLRVCVIYYGHIIVVLQRHAILLFYTSNRVFYFGRWLLSPLCVLYYIYYYIFLFYSLLLFACPAVSSEFFF